jgi:hypothetical protein
VEVLIAASRKEKIEDRVAAAEAAGLKTIVMDVESYASQAAFELICGGQFRNSEADVTVIVDIGATVTRVTVVHEGQTVYTREQQIGGAQLSQDIARQFDMPVEEAEAAKRVGNLPENFGPDVLQPFNEKIVLEIQRALQFFFTSTQFSKVDHILVTGRLGDARRPRGDDRPAHPGPYRGGESVRQHGAVLEDQAAPAHHRRAVAHGGVRPGDAQVRPLMIRINLLPHREEKRKRRQQQFVVLMG